MSSISALILFFLVPTLSSAQDIPAASPPTSEVREEKSLEDMSLEELMNVQVTVATKSASTVRDTPGIVEVITREEIQAIGARDLIDVLRLVPGFNFGLDGWVPVGPSVRGVWGAEGRILLLWDGIAMNENSAGGLQLGNHFPVDQIKRIEIIRGPGSVIYGGYAEVAVISITSLQADKEDRTGLGLSYGHGTKDKLRQHEHFLLSRAAGPVRVSADVFTGTGQRTDQNTFYSTVGEQLHHKGSWDLKPTFANVSVSTGDLQARFLLDQYRMTQSAYYGKGNLTTPQEQLFESNTLDLQYNLKVSESLSLSTFGSRQWQKPWWVEAGPLIKNRHYLRDKVGILSQWKISDEWSTLVGIEGMRDSAQFVPGHGTFPGGEESVSYTNSAAYAHVQYSGPVLATLGARGENHSSYGSFAVPRLALTKVWGEWHFKALYSHSFRSPGISNIELGVDPTQIKPEKTRTVEFEVGRQVGRGLLTLNYFDIEVDQPLVYLGSSDQYQNQDKTGSYGLEMMYKLRHSWGFLNSSVSGYTARHTAQYYKVPNHEEFSLAAPRVKVTLSSGIKVSSEWTIGPSLVFLGKRYGYDWIPERRVADYRVFEPATLVNLNVEYKKEDWTFSVAVHDILDQNPGFLQQYQGQMPQVPGPSREVFVKVRNGF